MTVKVAETLKVIRDGTGPARIYIDGELFEYGTVDGFAVHLRAKELPAVTLTIVAWRVEVIDDIGASVKPAPANEPGDSGAAP